MRADGTNNLDFSIMKNFKVSENNTLQYRCEFYNSTNTRNYGIPEARVNSAALGLASAGPTCASELTSITTKEPQYKGLRSALSAVNVGS